MLLIKKKQCEIFLFLNKFYCITLVCCLTFSLKPKLALILYLQLVKNPAISLLFSTALCAWLTLHKLLREQCITLKRSSCKWQLNALKTSYQILVKKKKSYLKKSKKANPKLCIEKPVCRRHADSDLGCACIGLSILYALVICSYSQLKQMLNTDPSTLMFLTS